MLKTPKPDAAFDQSTTTVTLPASVLRALRCAANETDLTMSQIMLEALLQDARIVMEMDLRRRAKAARP